MVALFQSLSMTHDRCNRVQITVASSEKALFHVIAYSVDDGIAFVSKSWYGFINKSSFVIIDGKNA